MRSDVDRASDAFIAIDEALAQPPHAQIFEQIRAMIERADLAPGDELPSVRQLAGDLGVAPNTVARAYADLKTAHWLESEQRKGMRVAAKPPALSKSSRRKTLGDAVAAFVTSLTDRGFEPDEIALELRDRLSSGARKAPT